MSFWVGWRLAEWQSKTRRDGHEFWTQRDFLGVWARVGNIARVRRVCGQPYTKRRRTCKTRDSRPSEACGVPMREVSTESPPCVTNVLPKYKWNNRFIWAIQSRTQEIDIKNLVLYLLITWYKRINLNSIKNARVNSTYLCTPRELCKEELKWLYNEDANWDEGRSMHY